MMISKIHNYLALLLVSLLSFSMLTACGDDDDNMVTPEPETSTLVDVAAGDERFSTLVGIVQDLGLEETLASTELTVFAPTNAAFEKISDAIPTLTNEDLQEIVRYHLIEGTVLSSDLDAQQDVPMLQGEVTLIQASAAGVLINGFANVVEADVQADNGVIHAIDEVLLPTEYRVALQGPSLVEVAEQNGNFETLVGLAEDTGFTTTLQFLGPFTAFAPTDEAFENLFQMVDPSTLTPQQIGFILSYHVLTGEILSTDLQPSQTVPTAVEEPLYITAGESGVTVNGASVTAADITDPTNGVIHVVDQVLLPNAFNSVAGLVNKNYDLTTLLSVVAQRPNILDALSDPAASLTVFAPDNNAFAAALSANPDLTDDQITAILQYHVLASKVLSTDLGEAQTVEALSGEALYVTASEGTVTINNSATVTTADLEGNNGAVHVIDGVLIPNAFQPVTGIVSKNYALSTLLSLVAERESILNLLSGEGEFTVFAPTNEAFTAALEAFPDLTADQITEILTYHVVGAQALSSDLSDGQTIETLQGEDITVTISDNVQINNATVQTADLVGTNGVVHIIDAVILPPSFTEE